MLQRTKYQNIPVLAATVHKFQGSERDMMIFDTVDSYPQERPGVLFFDHKNHRLVNVAVTRARGKFIQLSDCHYMRKIYRETSVVTINSSYRTSRKMCMIARHQDNCGNEKYRNDYAGLWK